MIRIEERTSERSVGKTSLVVTFDYNEKILNVIHQCECPIWRKRTLDWEIPISQLSFLIDNLTLIDDIDLKLLPDEPKTNYELIADYKTLPFDYQLHGIEWLINHPMSLLTDVPGLGKTLQMIYTFEELKTRGAVEKCLIICGINSLKANWKKEVLKHSDRTCKIIGERINSKGKAVYESLPKRAEQLCNPLDEDIIIMNVEMLTSELIIDAILNSKNKFDMIVIDEIHKLKNSTSQRGENIKKLENVGPYHYGLTGTLLVNNIVDAYMPLHFIKEVHCGVTNFKDYYCIQEEVKYKTSKFAHKEIVGYKHVDEIKRQLEECSLRRTKDLLDLPPKMIIPEYLDMEDSQYQLYTDLIEGEYDDIDKVEIKKGSLLGKIVRMRQATSCPQLLTTKDVASVKVERAIDLAEELIENGEKVVVFSTFKEPIYQLKERLSKYSPLVGTGDEKDSDVSAAIDTFQNDPSKMLFLGTIEKMATGITLNSASYMILIDSPWTNADYLQACDRIHRIGSKKTVFIYNLMCKDTIDERVYQLVNNKKELSDFMIDNKDPSAELKYLLGINGGF